MSKDISLPFTVLALLFCICFVVDSFMELKLVVLGNISITAGFLLITISYIVSDCIVELYGYNKAKFVMWLTFFTHIFVVSVLWLACWLPSDPTWNGNEHFNFIFQLTPRITVVSMFAFILGSSTNAYIMSKLKVLWHGKYFKWRAFLSTVGGEFVDAFSFFPLAFYGLLPLNTILQMVVLQATGKILYETLALPITSYVVEKIKAYEKIDTYDYDVKYTIFSR